jgi:LacI family transcriptional regulator
MQQPKSKVGIGDIARALGVHASTVSRALDPDKRRLIGQDVVSRVRAKADELGYRPDPVAAALRSRRSRLVGVLVPDIANPVFSPIIQGLESELAEGGFSLILAHASGPRRQAELVYELLARRVDGLVLASVFRSDKALDICVSEGVPAVQVNRSGLTRHVSSVVSDDTAGMGLAVDHLAGLGHTCIAHLAGPQNLSTGYLRRKGFLAAMAAHGLAVSEEAIAEAAAITREAGLEAARQILNAGSLPSAIVTANDLLALGAYAALAERGLSCPADVSVTGHNDMPLVDLVTPPLTTVRISHRAMGVKAARLLLHQMADPEAGAEQIVLSSELVVRGSTARRASA